MIDLRQGDCLEIMKDIPDGSVDMVLTDPPYGTTACKWDIIIPFDLMWEQLNRITKKNGAIVLFGSEPFSSALRMSNIKNYKYDWIWQKNSPSGSLNANRMPMKIHENVSVFYRKQCLYNPQKTKGKMQKKGGCTGGGVYGGTKSKTYKNDLYFPLSIQTVKKITGAKKLHPTEKPLLLNEYLLKTYTNENETVLDFTMGSGTTGVACKNLKRNFIGIELDENYFNIAKKRIEESI